MKSEYLKISGLPEDDIFDAFRPLLQEEVDTNLDPLSKEAVAKVVVSEVLERFIPGISKFMIDIYEGGVTVPYIIWYALSCKYNPEYKNYPKSPDINDKNKENVLELNGSGSTLILISIEYIASELLDEPDPKHLSIVVGFPKVGSYETPGEIAEYEGESGITFKIVNLPMRIDTLEKFLPYYFKNRNFFRTCKEYMVNLLDGRNVFLTWNFLCYLKYQNYPFNSYFTAFLLEFFMKSMREGVSQWDIKIQQHVKSLSPIMGNSKLKTGIQFFNKLYLEDLHKLEWDLLKIKDCIEHVKADYPDLKPTPENYEKNYPIFCEAYAKYLHSSIPEEEI